jgi:HD-GYP domain-containing protein (c-di-GMP phosphodiesterase class II)
MNTPLKSTHPLKKLLKPKKLTEFLNRTLAALPEGSVIYAYVDKMEFLRIGKEETPAGIFETHTVSVKNSINADFKISAGIPANKTDGGNCISSLKSILELTAFSISEYIESEHARKKIGTETLSKYRELALLHRSIVELNNSLRLKDVIHALIAECMTSSIPAELGSVYLPEECGFTLFDHFGNIKNDPFAKLVGSTLFTDVLSGLRGEIINDVSEDPRCDEKFGETIKSLLIMPIPSPNACEGALLLASKKTNSFKAAHLRYAGTLASVAGISISNAYNFESIRVLMDSMLKALAEAIDARDPFTAGHSERVAHLAVAFARIINQDVKNFSEYTFTDYQLREIYYSGILHDIGKIGIKEEVLTKNTRLPMRILDIIGMRMKLFSLTENIPWEESFNRLKRINLSLSPSQDDLDFVASLGETVFSVNGSSVPLLHQDERTYLMVKKGNLTAEERKEIERHPAESQRILEHIPFHDEFSHLLKIIRQHHERLDGSGYPDGVKGGEILLQSRILAIVDIFDAVTQERHYKPATPRDRALKILAEEAGCGKLDKNLVKLFIENIDAIEEGIDAINLDRPTSTRFCKIPRNLSY